MNANILRGKMAERGYTQSQLAKQLGITPQALNAKLNNRSEFRLSEVVKIIEILGMENPAGVFFAPDVPNMQHKIKTG